MVVGIWKDIVKMVVVVVLVVVVVVVVVMVAVVADIHKLSVLVHLCGGGTLVRVT